MGFQNKPKASVAALDRMLIPRGGTLATATVITTILYVVLHQIQSGLILPFQQNRLGIVWLAFPLISLAHGLRIIVAWMFGWYSFVILLPAALYMLVYLGGLSVPQMHQVFVLTVIMISAPLSINVLGFFGIDARKSQNSRTWWRAILLVGITSALFNSIAVHLFSGRPITAQETTISLVMGIVSSVAGLALVAGGLLIFFRTLTRP